MISKLPAALVIVLSFASLVLFWLASSNQNRANAIGLAVMDARATAYGEAARAHVQQPEFSNGLEQQLTTATIAAATQTQQRLFAQIEGQIPQ